MDTAGRAVSKRLWETWLSAGMKPGCHAGALTCTILSSIFWQQVCSCLLLLDPCLLFFSSHMRYWASFPPRSLLVDFTEMWAEHRAKHLLSTTGKWMVSFRKKGEIGEVASASNKMPSKYNLPERQWNSLLHFYHAGQFFIHHIAMIMTWLTKDCGL